MPAPSTPPSLKTPPPLLALWLAMLVALAPFALDLYLPAIPAIADYFSVPVAMVQSSLSTYLFGFVIGQFIGGPLSDQRGRKPTAIIGLIIFSLASFAISQCESAQALILWRFVQAIGGGAVAVVPAAIVRDCYEGTDVAKTLAMVAFITMSAPLAAPLIGVALLDSWGWAALFLFLGVYALLALTLFTLRVPETGNNSRQPLRLLTAISAYKQVLTHREGRRFIFIQAGAFSLMISFITGSSFVYMNYFGASPKLYAILFGCNIAVMILANRSNAFLLRRFQPIQILKAGVTLQGISAIILVIMALTEQPLWAMVPFNALAVGMMGWIGSNSMSCCLHYFKPISGTASALMGMLNFGLGGIAGGLLSAWNPETPTAMAVCMMTCTGLAFVFARPLSKD